MANTGKITQVIGSTFDAEFDAANMPAIYNAVTAEIDAGGQQRTLYGEISKHLGGGRVRCVALGSTEGLRRGSDCVDTGAPVSVPVGEETLGRVFNMMGHTIDGGEPIKKPELRSIHRAAPPVAELSTSTELFETGIKVVDLLTPFVRGGKAGLFGGAGLGKTVILTELLSLIHISEPTRPY